MSVVEPGVSPLFTPNDNFYRVDTALTVPQVRAEEWQLRIHGMVDQEIRLSFEDILARGLVEEDITLTCVSNTVGVWPGADTSKWMCGGTRLFGYEPGLTVSNAHAPAVSDRRSSLRRGLRLSLTGLTP